MKIVLVSSLLSLAAGAVALAQSAGTFTATGSMTTARRGHTATLLTDGRVLIAGGWAVPERDDSVATAELYDPATGTFSATGTMTTKRRYHSATLLADGRVLIAGGDDSGNHALDTAELYDPSTGSFSATGRMAQARSYYVAVLLPSGKVLLAGGSGFNTILISAEVYDPVAGCFSFTADLIDYIPELNTAILLPDGRAFIGGPRSQLYDYQRENFGITGGWGGIAFSWPDTQTLLANGNILVAGGDPEAGGPSDFAGVYNAGTGKFSLTGRMHAARDLHTATLLSDGTVLIAGVGQVEGGYTLSSADVYDPSTAMFRISGNMIAARSGHSATLLNSGQVLVTGGYGPPDLSVAELYNPPQMKPAPVLFALSGNSKGQGAIWNAITGQAASSGAPAKEGEVLSMYTTGLIRGGAIPPQVFIGDRLAEVLFFGDAPGYPGYNQVNFRVPAGVSPAAVVSVRLSYLGRSSNQVTIAVQ